MASSLTPTQLGEIAKPSRIDLIRLDIEKQGVAPDDNIYGQLPSTLTRGRECNLPDTHEHLLHTVGYPDVGKRRRIGTTDARWLIQATDPVAGRMGQPIGTETVMKLVFKKKGEAEFDGDWRAIEYRSLANIDGPSAIVVLTCTNEYLGDLEMKVKQHEQLLKELRQQYMQHSSQGEEAEAKGCRRKIARISRELSGMKEFLEEEKDAARAAEDHNAGVAPN